jgi:hypothetical protein
MYLHFVFLCICTLYFYVFTLCISMYLQFVFGQGERATGYGVSLLNCLFGRTSHCAMLQVPRCVVAVGTLALQDASPGPEEDSSQRAGKRAKRE